MARSEAPTRTRILLAPIRYVRPGLPSGLNRSPHGSEDSKSSLRQQFGNSPADFRRSPCDQCCIFFRSSSCSFREPAAVRSRGWLFVRAATRLEALQSGTKGSDATVKRGERCYGRFHQRPDWQATDESIELLR